MTSTHNMPASVEASNLNTVVTLLNELQTQLNNLRTDFTEHDHGSSYANATIRINVSVNSLSAGTYASTISVTSCPAVLLSDNAFGA